MSEDQLVTVQPSPRIGATAPPVLGLGLAGPVDSAALKGRPFVLYFYPKDSTPGCTTEAQDFRDQAEAFAALGVHIIGVSRDSLKSHGRFRDKESLPFELIADEDGALCGAWGVWQEKKQYGRSYMGIVRSTFLVNAAGVVVQAWTGVRVKGHVDGVLEAARSLPRS